MSELDGSNGEFLAKIMKLFNFLKKKPTKIDFSLNKCQKVHLRGEELTKLLHPQIETLLSKYYENELASIHFQEKKANSKDVFEAACVGLSIVNLVDLVEKHNESTDIIKKCLKNYKEIYASINMGCIYNHVMKYIQDYKSFTESNAVETIHDKTSVAKCFTGAWVIRYYIGEEATIQYDSTIEIGSMIEDTIRDHWSPNQK